MIDWLLGFDVWNFNILLDWHHNFFVDWFLDNFFVMVALVNDWSLIVVSVLHLGWQSDVLGDSGSVLLHLRDDWGGRGCNGSRHVVVDDGTGADVIHNSLTWDGHFFNVLDNWLGFDEFNLFDCWFNLLDFNFDFFNVKFFNANWSDSNADDTWAAEADAWASKAGTYGTGTNGTDTNEARSAESRADWADANESRTSETRASSGGSTWSGSSSSSTRASSGSGTWGGSSSARATESWNARGTRATESWSTRATESGSTRISSTWDPNGTWGSRTTEAS